eukprot:590513-Pleurochrysis_carterae.AAC.1
MRRPWTSAGPSRRAGTRAPTRPHRLRPASAGPAGRRRTPRPPRRCPTQVPAAWRCPPQRPPAPASTRYSGPPALCP